MPKVAHAGEDHRQAGRIRRRDHVRVVDRASRLDHGLGPRLGRGDQRVRERDEGVGRRHRAHRTALLFARGPRGVGGLERGDARGVEPAHLARADADRGAVLGIDDGVGFDVLANGEGGPSASSSTLKIPNTAAQA